MFCHLVSLENHTHIFDLGLRVKWSRSASIPDRILISQVLMMTKRGYVSPLCEYQIEIFESIQNVVWQGL